MMNKLVVSIAVAVSLVGSAALPQSQFKDANVARRSAASGLGSTVNQLTRGTKDPAWIAYTVPSDADYEVCCGNGGDWSEWSGNCGTCRLSDDSNSFTNRHERGPGQTTPIIVAFESRAGAIDRIKIFSTGCSIASGGQSITWLDVVGPADSVAYLKSLVATDNAGRLSKRAISAIALHADASALTALQDLTTARYTDEIRGDAVFWLAETHGHEGFLVAKQMVHSDASIRLKDKAIFALRQSEDPAAVDELIDVARHDESSQVRRKALFWLSQRAGAKAAAALRDAVENDPEESVKTQAVFAISQLPNDQSIPLLVQLARTHHSLAVRKKAVFWLGQKDDPRALEAIADMLK